MRLGKEVLSFDLSDEEQDVMKTHRMVGVPYTDDEIANAQADFRAQADPDSDTSGLSARYGEKVNIRNFDGAPGVSEMDALIAYLQMLGTLVDFRTFHAEAPENQR